MIIDYDESQRTGQVMTLAARGQFSAAVDAAAEKPVEKTMVLAVIDPHATRPSPQPPTPPQPKPIPPAPSPRDPNPREPLPPLDPGPFRGSHSAGVVLEKASADTGTHALPMVEKMTGAPSTGVDMHRSAARVQRAMAHLGVAVWYGEYTKEFWVMTSAGLFPFESVTTMYQGMGWQSL